MLSDKDALADEEPLTETENETEKLPLDELDVEVLGVTLELAETLAVLLAEAEGLEEKLALAEALK
jgi:hypothetical protein